MNVEKSFFETFLENNSEYKFIHKYMTDIYNFYKEYENINKISLNNDIKIEDYNKFLEEYVKFISKEYENVNVNVDIDIDTDIDIDIDIDNLCQCSFVLDL